MTDDSLFIPRSTIATFAQSPAVEDVLSSLRSHPLLSRTDYEHFHGGIQTIINKYPVGGTPDLLILEHDDSIDELERLAQISAPTTKLIVISKDNDISRYRRLLDQGGSDYLFTPITQELLLGAISRTFARAENRKVGTLLAFFSAGGGVGCSTIAQNSAVILSRFPGCRVMLLDFDVFNGSVALTFDMQPLRGLKDLLKEPKSISAKEIAKLAQDRSASLQILCSPPTLEPGFALKTDHFIDILDHARTLVDFIIIDMPGGWSLLHNKILAMSEHVQIVATPTLGSFQNLYNIEEQTKKLRRNLPEADVILNRWSPAAEKLIASASFADAAKGGRVIKVGSFEQASIEATTAGKALAELKMTPEPFLELERYLAEVSRIRLTDASPRKKSFLSRILPWWAKN